jgi:hypothetical protein
MEKFETKSFWAGCQEAWAKKIFEGRANSFGYCGWHERRKDEASSNRAFQFGYARQQGEGRKVMEKI